MIWGDDEAHFEVLNSTNQVLVLRLKTEINESFNFVPCVHGDSVLSVWGACLVVLVAQSWMIYSGRLNGSAYINVIEEALPMPI